LLVTNLADNEKISGRVEVETKQLDVSKSKMYVLNIAGTCPQSVEIKGSTLRIKNLAPLSFLAVIIE
ncbi:MAG: hypothetical protein ACPL3Q_04800, partial [Candidatus Ratteibacteria bacterium]